MKSHKNILQSLNNQSILRKSTKLPIKEVSCFFTIFHYLTELLFNFRNDLFDHLLLKFLSILFS